MTIFLPATLRREGWARKVAALARWQHEPSVYAALMRGYAVQVAETHGVSVEVAKVALADSAQVEGAK